MVLFKYNLNPTKLLDFEYLHSTMVLFKSIMSDNLHPNDRFTFHYGPIQIVFAVNCTDFGFVFTFHYGPIQIIF